MVKAYEEDMEARRLPGHQGEVKCVDFETIWLKIMVPKNKNNHF